jgi:aryl-alcohol dehydrogenase-like predicted oxidoreductase
LSACFTLQDDEWEDNIHEVLTTLDGFIKEGKIKHIGLSNENPWGIMLFLEENKYHNLPRVKPFKIRILLNRLFENASSEICARENVGLLAYSPMGLVCCLVNSNR